MSISVDGHLPTVKMEADDSPEMWHVTNIIWLQPLACWDCGFESHRGHGSLSVVNVVCCQVEDSATNWLLVQRNPTDCGASLCLV